ncbi:MAG: hypothetical protein L0H36_00845 [bacterium]|nr:hypothetical protein [bacterium]MDN5835164.1 hypothetical protein [bacterium]
MKKQNQTPTTKKVESTKTTKSTKAPVASKTVAAQTATVNSLPIPETHIQTGRDLKNAVLIVSLVLNLFMLIGWLVLQSTGDYNASVAGFLFR